MSLIIDDGKRSIRARRERMRNGLGGEENGSIPTAGLSLNGRESPSFGSGEDARDFEESAGLNIS